MKINFKKVPRISKDLIWIIIVAAVFIPIAIIILLLGKYSFLTLCIFKRITKYPCPTCGSTRLLRNILKGDILNALRMNPAVFIIFLIILIILILRIVFGIKIEIKTNKIEKIFIIICGILLIFANWIFLIIDKR